MNMYHTQKLDTLWQRFLLEDDIERQHSHTALFTVSSEWTVFAALISSVWYCGLSEVRVVCTALLISEIACSHAAFNISMDG